MATYSVSQGVPYDQQPPPYYQSGQPAYNPYYSQSQGMPYNSGLGFAQPQYGTYYQQPPPPVTQVHTTYVQRPAGGGTDAGDALCCGICLGCLLCCLTDSCK